MYPLTKVITHTCKCGKVTQETYSNRKYCGPCADKVRAAASKKSSRNCKERQKAMRKTSVYEFQCVGCKSLVTTSEEKGKCPYCKLGFDVRWRNEEITSKEVLDVD